MSAIGPSGPRVERLSPAQVAMAALCEAGRPDLAGRVRESERGWPTVRVRNTPDHDVVIRAFRLGHLSQGHDCRLVTAMSCYGDEITTLVCDTCDAYGEKNFTDDWVISDDDDNEDTTD